MGKNLYVGNLSYNTTQNRLQELFQAHGEVVSVNVITDRDTGRPRGFAFVEMGTEQAAKAAIAALDGQEVDGRELTVNEARPRAPRSGGREGGRGGGREGGWEGGREGSGSGGREGGRSGAREGGRSGGREGSRGGGREGGWEGGRDDDWDGGRSRGRRSRKQ